MEGDKRLARFVVRRQLASKDPCLARRFDADPNAITFDLRDSYDDFLSDADRFAFLASERQHVLFLNRRIGREIRCSSEKASGVPD
jgi:hypothetical protein